MTVAVFQTERLIVRPWTHGPADVDRIFDTYSRWEVARWLGSTPRALTSRDEAERAVDRWAARTDERWGLGLWAVEVRATGQVAGSVLLVTLPPATAHEPGNAGSETAAETGNAGSGAALATGNAGSERAAEPGNAAGIETVAENADDAAAAGHPGVEVGWHFHPDSWHHGYATEAARGALARGFAAGLTEIFAVLRPDNAPSAAVCRRLGMTPLGRSTRWYDSELEVFRTRADEWHRTAGPETP